MKKTLFMETTKISVEKTVAEIQVLLGQSGCSGVMTLFDDNKQVSAVCFKVLLLDKEIPFRLPCRWEPISKMLYDKVKNWPQDQERFEEKKQDIENQARRIAWRQIYRWIQAQLALIDTGMVKVQEVFLPYIQVNVEGQTLFQRLEEQKFKAIEYKN